jgi:SAM-dependent methyltransferase
MTKSNTDRHWNERALSERDDARVNIHDTVQRDLELDFIFAQLPADGRVLEIGCGNGYVTRQLRERARHVDAFDFAENMVARARANYGETNNRFFHASVLDAAACEAGAYDAAVCVRVLINLRDAAEQASALGNIAGWLKPGGKLILVEGFTDGFDALNGLRRKCDLPDLVPAAINFYSPLAELKPVIERRFEIADEFHTGMFDFLTRIVYPRLVGPDQVGGSDDFHRKIDLVARRFNPTEMQPLARVRGFALVNRGS